MIPLRPLAARLTAALFALAAGPAAAASLFQIEELYSNAAGTVQYVELSAKAAGQQMLSGHALVVSNGTITNRCTLSGDLPGDTNGRRMLLGTSGVSAAFGVTPDFLCANGFLLIDGATVNWDDNSDLIAYSQLPVNGQSINRAGNAFAADVATPQNYASTTTPPPTPTTAYQGMWWASPAGSESGWGLNTAHQGDTIFATWFSYDADGLGTWFIMSNASKTGDGVYSGSIYTTRGPPFSTDPFPSSQVVTTEVGTGTLTFTSPTAGRFAYTVNGVSQVKDIVRYEFGASVPGCSVGGAPNGNGINYQDLWWKSPGGSESGWGLTVVHQGEQMFVTWFTYREDGKSQWLAMPDVRRTTDQTFSGRIYRYRGNPFNTSPWDTTSVQATDVGAMTLSFSNRDSATFSYTLDGISQSKAITRTVFINGTVTTCNNP